MYENVFSGACKSKVKDKCPEFTDYLYGYDEKKIKINSHFIYFLFFLAIEYWKYLHYTHQVYNNIIYSYNIHKYIDNYWHKNYRKYENSILN